MPEIHESMESFDGTKLFYRLSIPADHQNPKQAPKGFVFALHGLGDHSGRYAKLAETTQHAGFIFAMSDLRGHGQSGNHRGDMESLSTILLDTLTLFSWLKKNLHTRYGVHVPCYGIFGHSFGGLLALYLANTLGQSCPKLFLSAPCLAIEQSIPPWKKTLAKSFALFMPRTKLPTGINLQHLSHDPSIAQKCQTDALYQKDLCLRSGQTIFDALEPERVQNLARNITTPITVVVSTEDPIVCVKTIRSFLDLCPRKFIKKANFITGALHEVFNESREYADQAFTEYQQWLGAC